MTVRAISSPRRAEPAISRAEIVERLAALRTANAVLARRSPDDVLSALDHVVAQWLAPESPWRRRAEQLLPAATGFSAEMIGYGLPLLLAPLRARAIHTLLADELGDRRLRGPALIAHIMSGNIPALSATSTVLSLAIGSCALIKAAHGDRCFPEMFVESIAAVDAQLGACVAATYWSGGAADIEDTVFHDADLVVAFGSDTSIEAMRARCRTRFIGHGHRISFALISRERLTMTTTHAALADDVSLWDQRGCLSPQVCFIEGDYDDACLFATALAAHLDGTAARWPPGLLDLDEQTAIRRFRDEAEWRSLAGEAVELITARDTLAWTLVVEAEPIFRPTPLGRSLRILPIQSLDMIPAIVAPAQSKLEAAAVAAPPERRAAIEAALKRAGVHWITDLGSMQKPPLSWTQGGRPRIADWIA